MLCLYVFRCMLRMYICMLLYVCYVCMFIYEINIINVIYIYICMYVYLWNKRLVILLFLAGVGRAVEHHPQLRRAEERVLDTGGQEDHEGGQRFRLIWNLFRFNCKTMKVGSVFWLIWNLLEGCFHIPIALKPFIGYHFPIVFKHF